RVSRFKTDDLRILSGDDQKGQLVKVGQLLRFAVHLPVVGISFQHYAVTRNQLFQAKRPQTCNLFRRSAQPPSLRKFSLRILLFQQMARKHGKGIEYALKGRVWGRKSKAHGESVQLLHLDGFVGDHQEIAVRRVDLLIEIHFEGKNYVIGIEGNAIRKLESAAQLKRKYRAIFGNIPGFRQGRLGLLRRAVDVD